MKRLLSAICYITALLMVIGLGVYFGAITAQEPHSAPFKGYADFVHFFYLAIYILIAAVFWRLGEWLAEHPN